MKGALGTCDKIPKESNTDVISVSGEEKEYSDKK